MNRRAFLSNSLAAFGGSKLLSLAPGSVLSMGMQQPESDRTLVIVELKGGNDALNTLVPYGDDEYFRVRKATRLAPGELHKLDDYRGLHPKLEGMAKRYADGGAAIFQGIGYPDSNRSHFKSREIWHTADLRGRAGNEGWLGRLCSQAFPDSNLPELSVHIGKEAPYSLHSATRAPVVFTTPDTYRWLGDGEAESALEAEKAPGKRSTLDRLRKVMSDAKSSSTRILAAIREYETEVVYPKNDSAQSMRTAAALIGSGLGSRVISVNFGGFDTHASQKFDHANSLGIVDKSLDAFMQDIGQSAAGKNTLVLVYSEFGRRVRENGSGGTDHGKAGVAFALGDPVRGGLYGKYPSLKSLDEQDLRYNLDFRSLYASAIRWMGGDDEIVLGAKFAPIPFV